jgi:hypothetical protein
MTYRLLGDQAKVEQILCAAMEQEQAAGRPTHELWNQRGIAAQGFGDDRAARDHLGRALALGSEDAGLVLARMDLVAGRRAAARVGFRAHILNQPPPDWAWRGWGTTLLPAAFAEPAVKPGPAPHPPHN